MVFITGASRGLGRALALQVARQASEPLALVLVSRSASGLEATRQLVAEVCVTLCVGHLVYRREGGQLPAPFKCAL